MRTLTRKLIRDLWASRWQYLAVGAMVLLGVAFFGAAYMSYRNLDASYQYSYVQLHFAEFSIALRGAPQRAADRVARIPGVRAAEGRLVEDIAIELPGVAEKKLIGRLISIPASHRPAVNDLLVVDGRYLSSPTAREVLLESSFASHHGLRPGQVIDVVRSGARARLRIAGIVKSPEYIFVVRSEQEILPLPDTFGVMFVSRDVLGPLVGKAGLINEVVAGVADPDRLPSIMREAKRLLSAYGPDDPVARADQPSHKLLQLDLEGFRSYSILFPALFLSVAALTVYTLLMRLVHLQRPVIGLLRALGHSRREIVRHYLGAALLIGASASILGTLAGYALSAVATRWYATFIAVPYLLVVPRWAPIVAGLAMGTGVCLLAGVLPARAAAAVGPAEALRAAAPATGRLVLLDRIIPGLRRLPPVWRLPLRNLFRQPRRTVSTIFGVAAAVLLIVTAQGLLDSSQATLDLFTREILQDDMRVQFVGYQDAGVVNRVRSWPGVTWAEPVLEIPVDLTNADRTYAALLMGLERGSRLYRLQPADGGRATLSEEGMLFGPTLRAQLGVEAGDAVLVSLPRAQAGGEPRQRAARVAGFVFEPLGTVAYLPIERARQLFGQDLGLPPGAISSVMVKVDPRYLGEVKARLLDLPGAGAVQVLPDIQKMLDDYLALARRYIRVMLFFGMSLAFAVVFNMVTVNVLERSTEVATMRTLGVTRAEIAGMVTAENLLAALLGVAAGIPLGRLMVQGFVAASQSEYFVFRTAVYPTTYAVAGMAILVVVLLSQLPALIDINRLNLARATKERAL